MLITDEEEEEDEWTSQMEEVNDGRVNGHGRRPRTPRRAKNLRRSAGTTNCGTRATPKARSVAEPKERPDQHHHLKFTYGVNAWKYWVARKNDELGAARLEGTSYAKDFETDLLRMRADELAFSLCLFVKEVKKPNGEPYAPDSVLYLALGIQE